MPLARARTAIAAAGVSLAAAMSVSLENAGGDPSALTGLAPTSSFAAHTLLPRATALHLSYGQQ